ncbi:fyve zinc finger protein [Ophiostoma piceae UAMH 11346]|uniref:RING-type E3 ubiquitin transferase n=1 Tax=Ophiostoma piceae (strain UAMH 11346) TaxID=1262450 RepID=S3CA65_OPHP1|nr:fyve zinc finger protein [Ophiostoma piceae UAMH 11346]
MSSLRGEGQDGIAADPTPVPTHPVDGSINIKNSINANSPHSLAAMDPIASNGHAEASGSAPVDSVSAPAPPTIPSDERPLPPTPTAELEPDILDPVAAEDPTDVAPATPAKLLAAAAAPESIRRASAARSQYQAPLPPTPQQASSQPQQPPLPTQQPRRLSQQEYIVPRWQPDSEVLYCPICFVYFSLFTRKHHCSCSPHRITIPHAFIVQPPEVQQAREQASAAGGVPARAAAASALPSLGAAGVPVGGERVRLCNPCVPDPNTSPPSSGALASQHRSNTHIRSRSGSSIAGGNPSGNYYSFAGPDASSSRSRRPGLDFFSPSGSSSGGGLGDRRFTVGNAQNPPGAGPPSSSSSSRNQYYGSLPPQNASYHHHMSLPPQPGAGTMSSASASSQHQHQHQPRYQIPEEDECPVCHLELPKRTLPNFEALREQHIEECISLHSQYMMGNTSGAAGRTRAASSAISATPSSSSRPQPTPSASRARRTGSSSNNYNNASGSDGSPSDFGGDVSSSAESMGSSGSAAFSPSSPRAMAVHRHTAMFPYKATEKDCASDAECTICLEDLEVGVAMARLECFCRFHEQCIRAWFVRHPGRCPVHQHGMAD